MTIRSCFVSFIAVFIPLSVNSQLDEGTSNIQVGGGWASVIVESTAETAHGYMVNGMFETWLVSPVGVGGSVHYLHVVDQTETGSGTFTSLPLYVNAKYYLGKNKFRAFVMASLGFQFSWRELEGASGNSGSDHDSGITAGIGAGMVYTLSPKVLLNLNYSLYWIKNAYYSNGLINTVSLNLGYILDR
jgi:hypothetical protein